METENLSMKYFFIASLKVVNKTLNSDDNNVKMKMIKMIEKHF